MNREEARSKVLDIYPEDAYQHEKGIVFIDFLIDLIYDNNLTIASADGAMTATDLAEFDQTVLAWNTNKDVELEDINGQVIIDALKTRGWVILPPS